MQFGDMASPNLLSFKSPVYPADQRHYKATNSFRSVEKARMKPLDGPDNKHIKLKSRPIRVTSRTKLCCKSC